MYTVNFKIPEFSGEGAPDPCLSYSSIDTCRSLETLRGTYQQISSSKAAASQVRKADLRGCCIEWLPCSTARSTELLRNLG